MDDVLELFDGAIEEYKESKPAVHVVHYFWSTFYLNMQYPKYGMIVTLRLY